MQVVFLCTQKRPLHLPSVGFCTSWETLHQMQEGLHVVQEIAPNATLGEHTVWYKWVCIIVQMGDAHYQHLGDALSYKWGMPIINIWGTHCRPNGGCVSHPRRAHNLVQIIVCYNYHSAELRVRGLPKMALWYICTFGHWHICISYFSLLSYKWGTTIINILGTHYRTNGGRCHRCTFPPLLRPLSYKWGTHCRTDGG